MTVSRKRFPECPIERTIAVLAGRWKARIVWQLLDSSLRYGELYDRVDGITERALTQALSELQSDGVLTKLDSAWAVTGLGMSLRSALESMFSWGTNHLTEMPQR